MSQSIYDNSNERHYELAKSMRSEGRAFRQQLPIEALGEYTPVDRDPVAILAAQNTSRIPELVPLRYARMGVSPFTFYRGSARLMAHDLAEQTDTGKQVVVCGDAHISNFGFFASPERRLVFDLNDFDESAPGPWEWDVKRLVTSVVLGARDRGFADSDTDQLARQCAKSYRQALRRLSRDSAMERYYASVDEADITAQLDASNLAAFKRVTTKARNRTSAQAMAKLTELDEHGQLQFVEEPPVLTHLFEAKAKDVRELYREYLESAKPDIKFLLNKYRLIDGARRVVGVGSVGTRCYVVLLLDALDQPLVIQIKEAMPSVITEFNLPNASTPTTLAADTHNGKRVVDHQRILQAVSDPFLGWGSSGDHQYYLRQFRDMKGAINLDKLSLSRYAEYVTACGLVLARAHSQSPAVHWLAGYLNKSSKFDRAMSQWASAYATQVAADYAEFVAATQTD